jgi:hypothetical protein
MSDSSASAVKEPIISDKANQMRVFVARRQQVLLLRSDTYAGRAGGLAGRLFVPGIERGQVPDLLHTKSAGKW